MTAESVVSAELDAAHERARLAYAARDAASYMDTFHSALEYRQHDGRTIGYEQLAADVRAQLQKVHTASSTFRRTALAAGVDRTSATEEGEQCATFEVRAFGILRRVWSVQRRGRYEWIRSGDGWQIRRAEILNETVESRISLTFGPAEPSA
jgi:hypothetical protein